MGPDGEPTGNTVAKAQMDQLVAAWRDCDEAAKQPFVDEADALRAAYEAEVGQDN